MVTGLEALPPVMVPMQSMGTSQRTKKLDEAKTGKLHQSQQPRRALKRNSEPIFNYL
jgi:hypothetical protein